MIKFYKDEISQMKLYSKCNSTTLRIEEPNCLLRRHYDLDVYNNTAVLVPCICLGKRKKYFDTKRFFLNKFYVIKRRVSKRSRV